MKILTAVLVSFFLYLPAQAEEAKTGISEPTLVELCTDYMEQKEWDGVGVVPTCHDGNDNCTTPRITWSTPTLAAGGEPLGQVVNYYYTQESSMAASHRGILIDRPGIYTMKACNDAGVCTGTSTVIYTGLVYPYSGRFDWDD